MAGVDVKRRNFFGDRFTEDELNALLTTIGMTSREVLSTRSRAYQTHRDEIDRLDDRELVREMVAEPTLLRRPILVGDGAHLVGAKNAELQQFVREIAR